MSKYKPTLVGRAALVFYSPTKNSAYDRGWYVRQYHSEIAMDAHFKHLAEGTPPPKHFGRDFDWWKSYSDDGPFTKKDAMEYALEL